jgi:hypothetical protein
MDVQMAETLDGAIGWCAGPDETTLSRTQTILLVEDEAFVREVTAEVLRSAGYRVLIAENAADIGRRSRDFRHC